MEKFSLGCAFIAGILLFIIYGGLCYIGATASGVMPQGMEQTELLVAIIQNLMGVTGMRILVVALIAACFTTAVGSVAGFQN